MSNYRKRTLRTKLLIGTLFFACMTACNRTAQFPTPNALTNAPQNQIVVATYRGTGIVESVDRDKGKVKIKHEEIKGYMEAMTMSFKLKDAKLLDNLNIGDKIGFTLEDAAGIITIIEIKKIPR